MAQYVKISELEATSVLGEADLFDVSTEDGEGYLSKKITFANVTSEILNQSNVKSTVIGLSLNNGNNDISIGEKSHIYIPYNAEIKKWTLLSEQTGNIQIDVWKNTYNNFPPTSSDSITGTNYPNLSSQNKNQGNVSSWTTTINAGDIIKFNVDSVTDIHDCILIIEITKE